MRIVVAGAIANKLGKGGEAWVRLGWALSLRELGHDVHLVEQIDAARLRAATIDSSAEGAYFLEVMRQAGLGGRAALVDSRWKTSVGLDVARAAEALEHADVLFNISGNLPLAGPARKARCKVYVDLDPGYTQLWHVKGVAGVELPGHDAFVTVGLGIGSASCALPSGGLPWITTLPPVALSQWPVQPPPAECRFTTVASWRGGYGRVEHDGVLYGVKAHEFRRMIELPSRSAHPFELALDIDPADAADREALTAAGWRLVDPVVAAGNPDRFRRYVQGSAAEFSVAQGIYVQTRCGWFSDRTAHYLASGRPALVQRTGFETQLPTGVGLLTFSSLDEAIAGADTITSDYEAHARAARSFAEQYLDGRLVLGRLLTQLGFGSDQPRLASPAV